MNPSATLLRLQELSNQIKDLSGLLSGASSELGAESVGFVVGTAADLEDSMGMLANDPTSTNPLESRELRHDLRNKISVIKGFSDLMRMDLSPGNQWMWLLDRLIDLADRFVELLDQVRDCSPAHCGAAVFA